eukprot:554813-Rhodomonas_salina.1
MQGTVFRMRGMVVFFALAGVVIVGCHPGHAVNRAELGHYRDHSHTTKQSNLPHRLVAPELARVASFPSEMEGADCTSTFCDEVCSCKKDDFTSPNRPARWPTKQLGQTSSVTSELDSENRAPTDSFHTAHSTQAQNLSLIHI